MFLWLPAIVLALRLRFPLEQFFLGDGEHLADGVVETLKLGLAGDVGWW